MSLLLLFNQVEVSEPPTGGGQTFSSGSIQPLKPWPRPRVRVALMASADGHAHAGGTVAARVIKLKRTSCAGHGTAGGEVKASVWQDDAAEILALVVALDQSMYEPT